MADSTTNDAPVATNQPTTEVSGALLLDSVWPRGLAWILTALV
jgi:hypothetical protein